MTVSLRDLGDTTKHTNIWILGVPEGEERKQKKKTLEEMLAENFSNLMQNINLHIQEGQ